MKLTATYVRSVRSEGKRLEIADDVVPGLWLRVTPSGAKTWCVRYNYAGQDQRLTLDSVKALTLEAARARTREVRALVSLGRDPRREKAEEIKRATAAGVKVSDLANEFFRHRDVRPKTLREFKRLWEVEIKPAFGDTLASGVERRAVRVWSERIAQRAPYVANRAFEVLRRFFAYGVERDLIQSTPLLGLRKPSKETPSERVLSFDELWALQRALGELDAGSSSDVVRLLLWTGVRREMVLGARRDEFHLDQSQWVIPGERTKNGKPHVVPMSKQALALVKSRLKGGVLLFPAGQFQRGVVSKREHRSWRSAYVSVLHTRMEAKLGREIPRWTIHNLRQTLATHLRESGVSAEVVSLILGHTINRGSTVLRVYDRAEQLKERKQALQAWADKLERLPDPSKKILKMKERA